jgi:hypothetical protein
MADSAISGPSAGDRVRLTEIDPEETFTTGRFPASEIPRACASRDAARSYLCRPLTTHADLAYAPAQHRRFEESFRP